MYEREIYACPSPTPLETWNLVPPYNQMYWRESIDVSESLVNAPKWWNICLIGCWQMRMLGSEMQLFLHHLYPIAYSWRPLIWKRKKLSLWSSVLALQYPVDIIFVWYKMQSQLEDFITRFWTWVNVPGTDFGFVCDKHTTNHQAEGNPGGYSCHDSTFKLATQIK